MSDTTRVRLLRNVGNRPELREGQTVTLPAAEAESLLAAALAEPAPVEDATPPVPSAGADEPKSAKKSRVR